MGLCHFPSFSSTPHNLCTFSSFSKCNGPHLNWETHHNPVRRNLVFSCSVEKSRKGKASKAAKSNADLCNELQEFISTMGLPDNHVPSMKELSEHGRKDLANIVRRRGYKVITELLRNSTKNDSLTKKPSIGDQDSSNACRNEASEVQERNQIESAECVSFSSGSSLVEKYMVRTNGAIATDTSVQICEPSELSIGSLHLKAANFIQTGELDMLEDASEVKNLDMPGDSEHKSGILSSNDADTAYVAAQQDPPLLAELHTNRDQVTSNEGLNGADFDEDLAAEMAGERDCQTEIDHLKAMLHQKEMELSELKQQIEKEKRALCILQAKANTEIGNAHRNISEKDVELRVAEECLSGLKEVQIEYWGNGETVVIAGSFNGWHHRIKMDLHPSSRIINPPGSRNSKLWSTVLWLYPGIYEIKFIVDGNWRVDSNREMITSGNITNNVLRVDR